MAVVLGGPGPVVSAGLARQPDAILVSAETVKDFQLAQGDLVNLRVQDSRTKDLRTVPFHYAGIVEEFPTAPKDSFFVANAVCLTPAAVVVSWTYLAATAVAVVAALLGARASARPAEEELRDL